MMHWSEAQISGLTSHNVDISQNSNTDITKGSLAQHSPPIPMHKEGVQCVLDMFIDPRVHVLQGNALSSCLSVNLSAKTCFKYVGINVATQFTYAWLPRK